ncbi:serine hydrolase domain-containing protein [Variovorax saccharolyticus]|uniref:serine hydrolase domain-containing protein n=1 Tax=Variovorax saccharolyticus TaxID=3053516 RepID=UPI0025778881|nr:serine hydrolase domain-containing protein [Variovorax sp. J31P216]MDM0029671.1 serine hydrolase domain-containing protein [Variovorax sp. J31P216]
MHFDLSRRRVGRWAGAVALAPWLASCGGGGSGDSGVLAGLAANAREARYVEAVDSLFATYHPPGILAGVNVAGQTPWRRAFGQADVARATPMALDSTFPIRSVTKSFTVTLLLQLVQSGQLALDHKIGRYIAGVPNGNLIDLADLAGNQSGLADYSMQPGFFEVFVKDTLHVWTPQELAAFSFAVTPAFLPGEQYQYSNTNTVLLGMVIEAVTGQLLGDALTTRIFRPLGLNGTSYPSSANLPPPTPTPYAVDVATGDADDQPLISPTSLAGSGAMASTLSDLLVWGDALDRGSLLSAELQELRKSRARMVTNGPEYDRYGLGIGQIGNWWGHTGSGVGFQVATMHLASRNATVSVMVNATPEGARRDLNLAQELFEKLAAVVEAG